MPQKILTNYSRRANPKIFCATEFFHGTDSQPGRQGTPALRFQTKTTGDTGETMRRFIKHYDKFSGEKNALAVVYLCVNLATSLGKGCTLENISTVIKSLSKEEINQALHTLTLEKFVEMREAGKYYCLDNDSFSFDRLSLYDMAGILFEVRGISANESQFIDKLSVAESLFNENSDIFFEDIDHFVSCLHKLDGLGMLASQAKSKITKEMLQKEKTDSYGKFYTKYNRVYSELVKFLTKRPQSINVQRDHLIKLIVNESLDPNVHFDQILDFISKSKPVKINIVEGVKHG